MTNHSKKRAKKVSVEESMRLQLAEASFWGSMNGFTSNFLVPFALLFNAGNFFVGMLTTLPGLVGSLVQLKAPALLQWLKSPKRYLTLMVLLQGVIWGAIALAPFFIPAPAMLSYFLPLILLGAIFSMLSNPVWMSYMGELIPVMKRATYFGKWNGLASILTFISTIIAGVIISLVAGTKGFAILFGLAAVMRFGSAYCLARSRDFPLAIETKKFGLRRFVKRAPTSDFGRFVSLAFLLRLAAYLSSPFFLVYELRILQLDYVLYTTLQAGAIVTSFLSMRYWARFSDRRGNRAMLMYTSFLIALVPLLWLTTTFFPALLLFEMLSGIAWGGFNLASSNYMLEATRPKTRTQAISYFNLFNKVAIVGGSIIGSMLLSLFGLFSGGATPFLILFAISGLLRLVVAIVTKPRLRELRFVSVPIREKGVTTFVNVLPQQGIIPFTFSTIDMVKKRLLGRFAFRKELDNLHQFSKGENIAARMRDEEREFYRDRFIEQATGAKKPRKPRGQKPAR